MENDASLPTGLVIAKRVAMGVCIGNYVRQDRPLTVREWDCNADS